MKPLNSQATEKINELSRRYGVSPDAVRTLLQALIKGNGSAAQFSHPELGGMGQWMRGGMTMVGNLFDTALKARVEGLCSDLSLLLAQSDGPAAEPATGAFQGFHEPADPLHPPLDPLGEPTLTAGSVFGNWWPEELGSPTATGAQNQTRYAYFPDSARLVVASNGHLTVYNTAGHRITGVSQQQSDGVPMTFNSPEGVVRVVDLPVISVTEEVTNSTGPVPA